MNHSEFKKKALKKKSVQLAYEALEPEFSLLRELLQARQKVGLSQTKNTERIDSKNKPIVR